MKNGPYTLIIAPPDYPGKRYRERYCYEHVYVAWKKYGRLPNANEEVHHVNESKRDNRPDNVEIKEKEKHREHHNKIRRMATAIKMVCAFCGLEFFAKGHNARERIKNSDDNHCSRSCSVKNQWEKGLTTIIKASPEIKSKILRLSKSGISGNKIAPLVGVSRTTVHRVLASC